MRAPTLAAGFFPVVIFLGLLTSILAVSPGRLPLIQRESSLDEASTANPTDDAPLGSPQLDRGSYNYPSQSYGGYGPPPPPSTTSGELSTTNPLSSSQSISSSGSFSLPGTSSGSLVSSTGGSLVSSAPSSSSFIVTSVPFSMSTPSTSEVGSTTSTVSSFPIDRISVHFKFSVIEHQYFWEWLKFFFVSSGYRIIWSAGSEYYCLSTPDQWFDQYLDDLDNNYPCNW
ncbi:hypothetical protein F5Y15DRAFT_416104 [Xylariaceae sp. FL0016]|nr:hypothetical protein F5Y15DRAFT_416104 [Xylariaceae sp. FL0016]